jgi:hypothetical protein
VRSMGYSIRLWVKALFCILLSPHDDGSICADHATERRLVS